MLQYRMISIYLITYKFHLIFCSFPLNNPTLVEFNDDFSYSETKISNEKVVLARDEQIQPFGIKIPKAVIPTHYKLEIKPFFDPKDSDEERFKAPGRVIIQVDCISNTKEVTLNSASIILNEKATKILTVGDDGGEIPIISHVYDEEHEILTLKTGNELELGNTYKIYIEYTANVFRDRLNGLYLSNYTNSDTNEIEYLVVTHFEPEDARQMFPCFDEPDMKSKFTISIGRRKDYNSLSNTDLQSSVPMEDHEDWIWDHYRTSIKMPTYLVAIAVSKFTSATAHSDLFGGKPVKVWTPSYYTGKGGGIYAANTAAKILQHYEKIFRIEYPLPKMDSIAVPHFEAGAMENFGLNTYRFKYLIYVDGETSESERYGVCSVIAHELAHQFFGDLVTCKSWSHLWLNEGFAKFVQNIGADATCPEFEPWNTFLPSIFQPAMQVDQTFKTHPIVNDSDPTAKFSVITYKKGASILRMMKDFLGHETFLAGLHKYLKRLSFGNALQDDLFSSLEEQAKTDEAMPLLKSVPLSNVLSSWTMKKGFPLVLIEQFGDTHVKFTQEKFVKPKYLRDSRKLEDQVERSDDELWWIPVEVATKTKFKDENMFFWMPSDSRSITQSIDTRSEWIVVNPDANGYFRCLYDQVLTERIKKQLDEDPNVFTANTRSQLLDDYFNLAFANYIDIKQALAFTEYLEKETKYAPWYTVLRNLKRSVKLLSETPAFPSLKKYLRNKLNPTLKFIGYKQNKGEIGLPVIFRSLLLEWACTVDDSECINYMNQIFKKWMENPNINLIPLDIRATAYCVAVKADRDDTVHKFIDAKYEMEPVGSTEKSILLRSLACSKNVSKIRSVLDNIFGSKLTFINEVEHFNPFIEKLATRSDGREALMDAIDINPRILRKVYQNDRKINKILNTIASYLYSANDAEKFNRILLKASTALFLETDNFASIHELIEDNQIWISKYYEQMKNWFEEKAFPSPRNILLQAIM